MIRLDTVRGVWLDRGMETTKFFCPEHAPAGERPLSYDDDRPACSVCGKANYAVKPYKV